MESIYNAPASDIIASGSKREQLGKALSVIGCILQSGIIIGIVISILKMVSAFQEITLYGAGDSKVMAGMISSALVSTVLGGVVAFPGLLINILALSISSYGSPWLFRALIVSSIFWMLAFPIGTILGVILLVTVLKKRKIYLNGLTNVKKRGHP